MSNLSGRQLRFLWWRMNSSFWFVPSVLTVAAMVLFLFTQYLDQAFVTSVSGLPLVFSGGADAARSVLGSISGAIITVTATSFSLAIVVLQLASSQYTPRVMQSFLADRGIQVVLGAFVGTFVYSLLVLRVIRTPSGATASFVPVISVTVAVSLALICVGFLIYFIHHVANLIQSSTIVQSAHRDSLRAIRKLDDLEGSGEPEAADDSYLPGGEPLTLLSRKSGYVQHLQIDLMAEALGGARGASGDGTGSAFLDLPFGPGFFVSAGLPIARLWTEGSAPSARMREKVRGGIALGKERSFQQDFAFGLRQLSDIALLGLSPGVNDPTSAMQAMDRIEAILISLGEKHLPRRLREYGSGDSKVTVRVGSYGFDDVVGLGLDQIRRSAFTSGQVAVLDRFLEVVDRAMRANPLDDRPYSLWERALAVARLAPREITDPRDAANLVLHAVKVGAPLLETGLREKVSEDLRDLARLCEGLPGAENVRQEVDAALRARASKPGGADSIGG